VLHNAEIPTSQLQQQNNNELQTVVVHIKQSIAFSRVVVNRCLFKVPTVKIRLVLLQQRKDIDPLIAPNDNQHLAFLCFPGD